MEPMIYVLCLYSYVVFFPCFVFDLWVPWCVFCEGMYGSVRIFTLSTQTSRAGATYCRIFQVFGASPSSYRVIDSICTMHYHQKDACMAYCHIHTCRYIYIYIFVRYIIYSARCADPVYWNVMNTASQSSKTQCIAMRHGTYFHDIAIRCY